MPSTPPQRRHRGCRGAHRRDPGGLFLRRRRNAVAVGGTFQFHSPGGQTEIIYAEEERAPLPDFSGPLLMEEGEEISLSDFEGEVVVLNAWGQWCAPCRAEVDDLQLVQETFDPLGGTVLGINVRDYNQTIAQDFKLDNAVTYPPIYDPPFRIAAALGGVPTSVIPTTIVLDRSHAETPSRSEPHTQTS